MKRPDRPMAFWLNHRSDTERVIAGAMPQFQFREAYGYLPKCIAKKRKYQD